MMRCLLFIVAVAAHTNIALAENSFATARAFLNEHCISCHGAKKQKGGLRLDTLAGKFSDPAERELWVNAMDQINSGEMPPEEKPRPPAAQLRATADWIAAQVRAAEAARGGGVALRRLTRSEYAASIRDLLGVPFDPIAFPPDEKRHGFDRIGSSLTFSTAYLEQTLLAARTVLDRAIVNGPRPQVKKMRVEGEEIMHPDLANKATLAKKRHRIVLRTREGNGYPDVTAEGEAAALRSIGVRLPGLPGSGPGQYRVKARVWGVPFQNATPRARLTYPQLGSSARASVVFDVTGTPEQPQEWEAILPMQVGQSGKFELEFFNDTRSGRHAGGELRRRRAEKVREPLPALYAPQVFLDYLEVEGPIHDQWPPASHAGIFFRGDAATEDDAYAREILARFCRRAFRRPVQDTDLAPLLALYKARKREGATFLTSVKAALGGALCSADFLYHIEDTPTLTAHQLAARLSFFLWKSIPDPELDRLADSGELLQPATLRAQTERMLADEKVRRFLDDFATQWLQLDRIGQFPPDPKLFPGYDDTLEEAMGEEARAFFREVFARDLDVREFLASDWTFANERLAQHYGIPGIRGSKLRRVALRPEQRRGGLLTMAGILSLSSDGTRQRPVHRGVWVLENILNRPPAPPPPNVPEIEPNVPGSAQLSVRARLEKHRSLESCATCHAKLDPHGLAFENYDAIGRWRDTEGARAIDASGELPGGRKFANAADYKALLLAEHTAFTRALVEKLALYATGRELTLADRPHLAQMERADASRPTLRAFVTRLIASPVFLGETRR
jgi:cytochrome c553